MKITLKTTPFHVDENTKDILINYFGKENISDWRDNSIMISLSTDIDNPEKFFLENWCKFIPESENIIQITIINKECPRCKIQEYHNGKVVENTIRNGFVSGIVNTKSGRETIFSFNAGNAFRSPTIVIM